MARSLDALDPFNVRWCRQPVRCVTGATIAPGWVGFCWETPLSKELLTEQAPALASIVTWAERLGMEGPGDRPSGDATAREARGVARRRGSRRSQKTMVDSTGRTTRGMVELEDARDMMELAAAALERWNRRLESIAKELPEPRYAEGTDDPLNLSAAWQGRLDSLLKEDLEAVISTLRQLAQWHEERGPWQGDWTP